MSTEDPIEPPRVQPPRPLRRTRGFWSLPDQDNDQTTLDRILPYVEPISDEEAAEFGVPLLPIITVGEEIQIGIEEANRLYRELAVSPVVPRPEVAPAEDDSFDTERFGSEDGHAQNGIPVHPQFMPTPTAASVSAIRPRMRRR